ncbi:hypothetical protein RRG08_048590 [Elysia crispata]|uniref:Uncharacterized protein n=1 Tax=Elysia crispata TaxID=231223 RepID=A0AAE1ACS3_9GAST|nr:hypothetical protein RRG08_048590 [Elysia crispata]
MESCEAPAGLATRYMSVALQISNHTALTVMRKRGGNSQASVHWRPAGSSSIVESYSVSSTTEELKSRRLETEGVEHLSSSANQRGGKNGYIVPDGCIHCKVRPAAAPRLRAHLTEVDTHRWWRSEGQGLSSSVQSSWFCPGFCGVQDLQAQPSGMNGSCGARGESAADRSRSGQ